MHDQPEQTSADVRDLPEIEQDIVRLNKPLLLAALAAAGAGTATVAYEGYGDEGQIENTTIEDAASTAIELTDETVVVVLHLVSDYRDGAWHWRTEQKSVPLSAALQEFVWGAIELHHSGFENIDRAGLAQLPGSRDALRVVLRRPRSGRAGRCASTPTPSGRTAPSPRPPRQIGRAHV